MSNKRAAAVTNLQYYKNQTKAGNPTATAAKKGLHYYTFGQDESMERLKEENGKRGTWYDSRGAEVTVPQMTEWTVQNATENKYTYTAVLSLRDGEMSRQDFIDAMNKQEQFSDYRLIVHRDSAHDHAHVMMFRDKTLTNKEFNTWRKTVGSELDRAEQHRLSQPKRGMSAEATAQQTPAATVKKMLTQEIDNDFDFDF